MKAYLSVFKMRLNNGLQYRAAALAGIGTQFFFGFIFIMIFEAFYAHTVTPPEMTLSEVITYTWLKQAFLAFVVLWLRDNELFQLITSGNIAYELCRPSGLYGLWYAKLLAQRISSALLRCFPILIVTLFLPEPYRLKLPPDFPSLLLFLAVLIAGLLMLVAISMLIYISVFVTMSPAGSLLLFSVFGEFFAGLVIPVPLMPEWMQKIVYVLPFHWTADFPFRVFTGNIGIEEASTGLLIQLIWLAALVAIGYFTMKKALSRIVVQGG
ncbi:ABC transporter permease [Paenibacillus radicis (ex Gao et al. 2016)]|uniref:ABC transporter permease n=1 Tax=Paenibacillus radicis (ex Gao et al. 2016) TaxID=1737354 RepID=A0A917H127_9BACL|nr:ABC transporter permease [Paenibacillus radicis (ex Gao et al. 2016)]GGG64122.1 ABC transporter permease [Paenibacillus radicis (ex Gao et al. 2016)]